MIDRDTIIKLARDAGVWFPGGPDWERYAQSMERFATLIAAHEREACAKVCDEQSMRSETSMKKSKTVKARDIYSAAGLTARWMSAAIRARGETK